MIEPTVKSADAAVPSVKKEEGWWETVKVIIEALLIALVVRTVLFQPFNIPSGSLVPTLLVGDYLFVSKYAYGYSHFSLPSFLDLDPSAMPGRIFASDPKRGDIIVFKLPSDGQTDYIKRLIGLPGDKIQVTHGRLIINGEVVPREPIQPFNTVSHFNKPMEAPQYLETLPGGVQHRIIQIDGDDGAFDNTKVYEVPPGHYFMMGDNRDNSSDSRLSGDQGGVGYVPFENLIGRAEVIFFSIEEGTPAWELWRWPWTVRWDRIFQRVRYTLSKWGRESGPKALWSCGQSPFGCLPFAAPRRGSSSIDWTMNKQPRAELSALESRLGYCFRDTGLAALALTHLSAQNSGGQGRAQSYQRLEFLGDRVLGVVIASRLYQAFPKASEGELSMRFAKLVRRETCAEIAAQWDVGPHVALGLGEARGGGRKKQAILADVCESLIGAVFVDGGFAAAEALILSGWGERITADAEPARDAKTAVQEWAQSRALAPPHYEEVERSGPAHAPHFVMRVVLEGFEPEVGAASSKRAAEQAAAQAFLDPWGAT